jgi:hypothetical protein
MARTMLAPNAATPGGSGDAKASFDLCQCDGDLGALHFAGGNLVAAIQLPANSVKAPQIAKNAVGTSELRSSAVQPSDVSQTLATSLQGAVAPGSFILVPPRGDNACAVYGGGVAGCVNVSSKTYNLGFLASHTSKLSCPSGGEMLTSGTYFELPAYVIDTSSGHYTGATLAINNSSGSFTFTNWSTKKYAFTAYTACKP